MRPRTLLLICVVLVASLIIMGAAGYVPKGVPARTTWEYKVPGEGNLSEDQLNQLGAQGWELAGMTSDGNYLRYCLKRPK